MACPRPWTRSMNHPCRTCDLSIYCSSDAPRRNILWSSGGRPQGGGVTECRRYIKSTTPCLGGPLPDRYITRWRCPMGEGPTARAANASVLPPKPAWYFRSVIVALSSGSRISLARLWLRQTVSVILRHDEKTPRFRVAGSIRKLAKPLFWIEGPRHGDYSRQLV